MAQWDFTSIDKYKAWVQKHVANWQTVESCLKHAQDNWWTIQWQPITEELITKFQQEAEEEAKNADIQKNAENFVWEWQSLDVDEKLKQQEANRKEFEKKVDDFNNISAIKKAVDIYKAVWKLKADFIKQNHAWDWLSWKQKTKYEQTLWEYNKLLQNIENSNATKKIMTNVSKDWTWRWFEKLRERYSTDDEYFLKLANWELSKGWNQVGKRGDWLWYRMDNSDFFNFVSWRAMQPVSATAHTSMQDIAKWYTDKNWYYEEPEEDYSEREDERPF
jgi:hypothetical protein